MSMTFVIKVTETGHLAKSVTAVGKELWQQLKSEALGKPENAGFVWDVIQAMWEGGAVNVEMDRIE